MSTPARKVFAPDPNPRHLTKTMVAFLKPDVGNAVKYLVLSAAATPDGALAMCQVPCKTRYIKLLNGLKSVVTGVG